MKLVIFIPCLNEEQTLPTVLNSIPTHIDGVDIIETIVVDDGSTDNTAAVARAHGANHIIRHRRNQGLAYSFRDGMQAALDLGADIIVLTDGDNQYPQERIPDLVRPIIDGEVDSMIADRQTATIEHFSASKKLLQRFGTWVVNLAAGTQVPDATSGFRAWSRQAALRINLVTRYSFGMETVIQAGNKRQAIGTITIETNPKTRESRLFKSPWQHARRQSLVIVRSFAMYKPGRVFMTIGVVLFAIGLIPFLHYFYIVAFGKNAYGAHHLQSLIIGGVFLNAAFFSLLLGILADLIRMNRSLIEDVLEEQRRTQPVRKEL